MQSEKELCTGRFINIFGVGLSLMSMKKMNKQRNCKLDTRTDPCLAPACMLNVKCVLKYFVELNEAHG